MADGSLEYALELQNRGFIGPLAQAGAGVGRFAGRIAMVAGPLAVATSAAAGLTFAIKSLDKAGEMEQFEVGIKNILGSEAAARLLRAELEEFSTTTPFTFMGDVAPASRMLLNAGISAADMRGELQALGNVASGAGKDLLSVAEIYSKALNRNVVNAEILDSFRIAMVPIDQMLADTLGVAKSEVSALASEGKISGDILRAAFQKLGSSTGKWGQMMKEQSLTNKGLMSTLKDNVDAVMVAFGQPINDAMRPLIQDVISKVQELKPQIASIGAAAGEALTKVYTAATNGKLGELLKIELLYAGARFINFLGSMLPKTMTGLDSFGSFMGNIMTGAGRILEGSLMSAAGKMIELLTNGLNEKFIAPLAGAIMVFNQPLGSSLLASMANPDMGLGKEADAAKADGKGIIGTAVEAIQRGFEGKDIIPTTYISGLEKYRNKLHAESDALAEAMRKKREEMENDKEDPSLTDKTNADLQKKVDETKNALAKVQEGVKAAQPVGLGIGIDEGEQSTKRRGILNAEESQLARFQRMSRADKEKFGGDFDAFRSRDFGFSDLGRSKIPGPLQGAGDVVANLARTINPNARAIGRAAQKKEPPRANQLIALLQKVEANTAAFRDVLTT